MQRDIGVRDASHSPYLFKAPRTAIFCHRPAARYPPFDGKVNQLVQFLQIFFERIRTDVHYRARVPFFCEIATSLLAI
jgi:hypothetical protein